jgi:hypothetical protein
MPRTFKQWTPATPELELLHECWLGRLPPAKIAARLCISEPKLKRFMRRVHAAREMPRPELARPRQPRHQASSKRRIGCSRASSAYERGGRWALIQLGGGGECGPVKIETKSN